MAPALFWAADLVAVSILAFGLYLPRHHRRDLVVSYLVVNVGVLAVSTALASSAIAAGLGLGLFGVLSIIRLRSAELAHHEIAYYFAALALGLLGGLGSAAGPLALVGMAVLLLVLAVADHPRLAGRARTQTVLVDRAIADHGALVAHLGSVLGATVHTVTVQRLDLVNDSTLVNVRFTPSPTAAPAIESIAAPTAATGR
ncbi:conserved hypothetical protein [Xylanimonas cellulosilytica DSM 15894]|uniref:Permease n=1 Tax=Xylanimonas cellulosilytica (strain DSM 15894 / JCM 12276 / CECT 5975 / KCTC 9989 / LMG 20990 / NBRC 107835 / XIL07) TaxID=446471 RepID=D1C0K5_XYLCX|nr:DUF4956 domain-containing protein [Xylanimonas cellulosilytica]ACZ32208.1 conserved hypothetical protein [Xylanimonas cellulosilytica DSM 15894]